MQIYICWKIWLAYKSCFNLLCDVYRNQSIIAIPKFQYILTIFNVYILEMHPNHSSLIHLHKLLRQATCCFIFSLSFSTSFENHIIQSMFPIFFNSLSYFKHKVIFISIFLKSFSLPTCFIQGILSILWKQIFLTSSQFFNCKESFQH